MQNLIDSHDTERVASMIVRASRRLPYQREDSLVWFDYDWGRHATPSQDPDYLLRPPTADERAVLRLVALFQMTWVGAPMVYYGTESGMWGADDPDDRQPMVWEDIEYADRAADPLSRPTTPAPLAFDAEWHEYYRSVIALRRSHAALRTGEAEFLHADEATQTVAFARTLEDERLVVVLNRSSSPVDWITDSRTLELGTGEGLYPIFSTLGGPGNPPEADAAGSISITMRPLEGRVFIRTGLE
jgi:cyclomaltodextrinase / maltogenic alpha-amylase / neopullulanase